MPRLTYSPHTDPDARLIKLTAEEIEPWEARFPMVPRVRIVRLALQALAEKLDAQSPARTG